MAYSIKEETDEAGTHFIVMDGATVYAACSTREEAEEEMATVVKEDTMAERAFTLAEGVIYTLMYEFKIPSDEAHRVLKESLD